MSEKLTRRKDPDGLLSDEAIVDLFFSRDEAAITESDHGLPTAQVQIDPNKGIDHSTSPDAVGLYLCALLSSAPVTQCIQSYMNPTSISAHVLSKLKLPDFDPDDSLHLELARLCMEGHKAENHTPYLEQISHLAARMYLSL